MPATYKDRTIEKERQVAEQVAILRAARGWSYADLAARMKAVGCDVHPSGIQKTEKQGRRVTVDELVGYARAFEVQPEVLLGEEVPGDVAALWATLESATRLAHVKRETDGAYWEAIERVRTVAAEDVALRQRVELHREVHWRIHVDEARRQAERDGEDISTVEAWEQYLRAAGVYDEPTVRATTDILDDDGPSLTYSGGSLDGTADEED